VPKLSFSREKRLLSARDYKKVFDGSRFKIGHKHLLLLATFNSLGHPRLGLVIAKKNVNRAVDRNRIKRCARELFRLYQNEIGSVDIVVLTRRGLGELDKPQLNALFQQSFRRMARKVSSAQQSGVISSCAN
jgi:ribonuclease P protein component